MTKFIGGYAKLKKYVSQTGFAGQWREPKNGHVQFHAKGGAVLNWWKSTGTIQFQGRDPTMKFERAFISIASTKGRLEESHDWQNENAALRKLIVDVLFENSTLKQRVSKLKNRLSGRG
jgi:hypothetical protein